MEACSARRLSSVAVARLQRCRLSKSTGVRKWTVLGQSDRAEDICSRRPSAPRCERFAGGVPLFLQVRRTELGRRKVANLVGGCAASRDCHGTALPEKI